MEKLQPIIKHHFWILFGIAAVMPPVAWFLTTGDLQAEIDTRSSALDSAFSGIKSGTGAENQKWTNDVNGLIEIRKESNRRALKRLWDAQLSLQQWPSSVRPVMEQCAYRGDIEDLKDRTTTPILYREAYEHEIRRVWLIPEPIDDPGMRVDPGTPQKVLFPPSILPRVPQGKWSSLPPSSRDIWNAQEDLWLLTEVLSAVKRVNEGTTSITDSYIRRITELHLFGGTRAAAGAASASATGGNAEMAGMAGMNNLAGGRNRRSTALGRPADFPISEEYTVSGGGLSSGSGGGNNKMMSMNMGAANPGGANQPAAADGGDPDAGRYLAKEWAYRTRGFKIRVAIDQMRIPDFIRQLLNSRAPVEITRFQWSALNPDEPGQSGRSGRSFGGPGRGLAGNFPGASAPGGAGGGPESGAGQFEMQEDQADDDSGDFNAGELLDGIGADGAAPQKGGASASANASAALGELDLVDLVVVGELYIYEEAKPDEAVAGTSPAADSSDSSVASSGSGLPVAAPSVGGAGTETPAAPVTPINATPAAEPGGAETPAVPDTEGVNPPAAVVTPDDSGPAQPSENSPDTTSDNSADNSNSPADPVPPAADSAVKPDVGT